MSKDYVNIYAEKIEQFVEVYAQIDSAVENLESMLMINRDAIDEEIIKQPSRFAWLGAVAEKAKAEEAFKKREWEKTKKTIEMGVRMGTIPLPDGVKSTEKSIDAMVEVDEEVSKAHTKFIEAKRVAGMLLKAVEAMGQKSDMLRTFSVNLRKERESEFVVKKTIANDRVGKNLKKEVTVEE